MKAPRAAHLEPSACGGAVLVDGAAAPHPDLAGKRHADAGAPGAPIGPRPEVRAALGTDNNGEAEPPHPCGLAVGERDVARARARIDAARPAGPAVVGGVFGH